MWSENQSGGSQNQSGGSEARARASCGVVELWDCFNTLDTCHNDAINTHKLLTVARTQAAPTNKLALWRTRYACFLRRDLVLRLMSSCSVSPQCSVSVALVRGARCGARPGREDYGGTSLRPSGSGKLSLEARILLKCMCLFHGVNTFENLLTEPVVETLMDE